MLQSTLFRGLLKKQLDYLVLQVVHSDEEWLPLALTEAQSWNEGSSKLGSLLLWMSLLVGFYVPMQPRWISPGSLATSAVEAAIVYATSLLPQDYTQT